MSTQQMKHTPQNMQQQGQGQGQGLGEQGRGTQGLGNTQEFGQRDRQQDLGSQFDKTQQQGQQGQQDQQQWGKQQDLGGQQGGKQQDLGAQQQFGSTQQKNQDFGQRS